jgi:hypothetical protein
MAAPVPEIMDGLCVSAEQLRSFKEDFCYITLFDDYQNGG